ncbi:MAG: fibronectin type III domain-containing protein, partial [Kofleriaceae bacterium]
MLRRALLVSCLAAGAAHAEDRRCLDVQFTPADNLQIVAWIADATGAYIDTVYVTQQIGTFGLGNRPGRFDFNSGPAWPYGRRITTFPVWSHANGQAFSQVIYQNDLDEDPASCFSMMGTDYPHCPENDLSHPIDNSSSEAHFCRPMMPTEPGWDTGTCATRAVGTDKGRFSTIPEKTGYPPRSDLTAFDHVDSPAAHTYKMLNPFDAVSQPTPIGGTASHAPWPIPTSLPAGDYVLFVETAKEFDFNATYNETTYPPPIGIFWAEYGKPFRGQPSVVYRVPFTIAADATSSTTLDYAGYGDPDGKTGTLHPPDATITNDTPGTGGSRLQLVADDPDMYRVRVIVNPHISDTGPALPDALTATDVQASAISLSFVAPGVGSPAERVSGYEIRIRASTEMTADNFATSMPVTAKVTAEDPGHLQTLDLTGLLPETDYWIGVRAFDGCHTTGPPRHHPPAALPHR